MSTNKIDDLFKKKLDNYSSPPSTAAWSKVQAGLSKKNKGVILWRVAAALLLMGVLISTVVWLTSDRQSHTISQIASKSKTDTIKKDQSPRPIAPVIKNEASASVKSNTVKAQKIKKPIQQESQQAPIIQQSPVTPVVVPEIKSPIPEDIATETLATVSSPKKPIVLEYRLPSVKTESALSERAIAKKEKSGFKKVIEFALEAKNGEGPVSLRQAKEEIFALNFTKDKQKNHK